MRPLLLPASLHILPLMLPLVACDSIRALVVQAIPDDYEVQGEVATASMAPKFEGGDVTDARLEIELEPVAQGFEKVTDIQFPPGRSDVMVVLQKTGEATAVTLASGTRVQVLDLAVDSSSELGLLGLAFHPRWPQDRRIFVNYNPELGNTRTRIASWSLDPDTWKASDEVLLMEVDQPYGNHDAGQLMFGPDGMLYIGLGDGGWRDDPQGNGQNAATMLGSMLRIDIDRKDEGRNYAVPPDNPFIGKPAPTPQTDGPVPPETWAIGLRNPWRYSFDPKGRLVVADVGQNAWEEVSLVPAGANLGWKIREGRHCFPPKEATCPTQGLTEPVFEYDHQVGQSITGGYVYLADDIPALTGRYLVGDFTRGWIWALQLPDQPGQEAQALSLGRWQILPSTFGRDGDGRVYVGDYAKGHVYRLASAR